MEKDDYRFVRKKMVREQLKQRGIKNTNVLQAFEKIPRHIFVCSGDEPYAYEDYPLPLYQNQTISQPFVVAQMIEALDLSKDDIVLEIGTGTGYQTAILSTLAKEVYSIERISKLHNMAIENLQRIECTNISCALKDGKDGWIEIAPFDKIIVSAASRSVPDNLINQLADGGKMIMPVGGASLQKLLLINKANQKLSEKVLGYCKFVKLV